MIQVEAATQTALRLNLGSGSTSRPGYVNVDRAPGAHIQWDLRDMPWPWETSSVEAIQAHDIIEHLPDRIGTMNEIHRILKPGARVDIITPNAAKGAGFAQDPTHVSQWCLNSFQYYEHGSFAQSPERHLSQDYGITASFRIVSLDESRYMDVREEVWKIHAVLEAVK